MKTKQSVIRIYQGCTAYKLLLMIAAIGEFPVRARNLIGKDNVIRHLITRMQDTGQEYVLYTPDHVTMKYTGRLISIVKPEDTFPYRSMRLTKGGRYVLSVIAPSAYECYMDDNRSTRQSTRDSLMRSCRVGESVAMAALAGCEFQPCSIPVLQVEECKFQSITRPVFYQSKILSKVYQCDGEIAKKGSISRLTGVLVTKDKPYAVYHTLGFLMKWNGNAERHKRASLEYIAALNWDTRQPIDSCILFAWESKVILETMSAHKSIRVYDARITDIYQHIYYIPVTLFGAKLLKTLMVTGGRSKILEIVFGKNAGEYMCGQILADAKQGDTYYWTFFDADIQRLWELKSRMGKEVPDNLIITCYDGQEDLIESVLPNGIRLKRLSIDAVLTEIKEENIC